MAGVPGESIGTARIDIIADTAAFEAQVARAKSQIATLGPSGEASFAKMTAAQKRATLSALQFEQSIGKSRDEMRLLSLAARGAAPEALERLRQKMLDVKAASAGAALDAARFSDAQLFSANKALQAFRAEAAAKAASAETDAQATVRIRDMVQASLAAEQAERARAEAQRVTNDLAVKSSAAQIAASKTLVKAQTEQMAAYTAMRAPVMEVEAILQKRVLTTEEVARVESLLDKAQATGAITTGELTAAFAALDRAKVKDIAVTEAQTVANKQFVLSSRAMSEIPTAISEVLAGNPGRLRRTGAAFLNQSGVLQKLFTPAGLGITAALAAIGTFTVAVYKGEEQVSAFNAALVKTGDASGASISSLQRMTQALGAINGSYADAREAVLELATSGKITDSVLQQAGQSAIDYARVTGKSMKEAVAAVVSLQDDPVKALEKLDESMHFLTPSILGQVEALQQDGKAAEAAAVAERAFADANSKNAEQIEQNLGTLQRLAHDVGGAFSAMWNSIEGAGRPASNAEKLDPLFARLKELQNPLSTDPSLQGLNPALRAQEIKQVQDQIKAIQTGMVKAGFDRFNVQMKNANEKAFQAAVDGLAAGAKKYQTEGAKVGDEIAKVNQQVATAVAYDPAHAARYKAQGQNEIEGILSKYHPTMQGAGGGQSSKAFDQAAYFEKANEEIRKEIEAEAKLHDQQKARNEADADYKAQLDQQLATRKAAIDLQVASIGMGQKEFQQYSELNDVYREFDRQLARLNKERDAGSITIDQYNKRLAELRQNETDTVKAMVDGFKAADMARADWQNGMKAALQDFIDEQNDVAGRTRQFTTNFIDGFGDAFAAFASGTESAKDAFGSFIDDMERQALKALANKAIQELLGGFDQNKSAQGSSSGGWGGLFSAILGAFSSSGSSGTSIASSYMANGGSSFAASGVNWDVGALATGGPASAGRMYRVAEDGPELLSIGNQSFLMMGNKSGHVTPNSTLRDAGSGKSVTVNQTVVVGSLTSRRTREQLAQETARRQRIATARG